jgi:predicted ATP-dependent protease
MILSWLKVDGEAVGQINGLSVIHLGDYIFGKPSKITATTFIGRSGIVNIEREVEMSGNVHSKGVMISELLYR